MPIIVEIADRHAVVEAAKADACALRDVGERAVAAVLVEPVAPRFRRQVPRQLASRGEVEVEAAVAVEVEQGHPAPVGRREFPGGSLPAAMEEIDAGRLRHLAESQGRRLGCRRAPGREGEGRGGRTTGRGLGAFNGRFAIGRIRLVAAGDARGDGQRQQHEPEKPPIRPAWDHGQG